MSTENLKSNEAIEKLRTLVDGIDVGMLGTYTQESEYVYFVPMSQQEIDETGCIWYLISSASGTFKNLQIDSKISLTFSDPSDYTFLSLEGRGEIHTDPERIEKYWNKFVASWFDKGKDDPRICVLKVNVEDAHYWDTKSNKLITLFKLASSALTGDRMELGREGNLDL